MPLDLYSFLERLCLTPAATHAAGALAAAPLGPRSAGPESCRTLRFVGAPEFWPNDGDAPRLPRHPNDPARWNRHTALTSDYWTPPPTERRHGRGRILAVILAFVLAVILVHAGW